MIFNIKIKAGELKDYCTLCSWLKKNNIQYKKEKDYIEFNHSLHGIELRDPIVTILNDIFTIAEYPRYNYYMSLNVIGKTDNEILFVWHPEEEICFINIQYGHWNVCNFNKSMISITTG